MYFESKSSKVSDDLQQAVILRDKFQFDLKQKSEECNAYQKQVNHLEQALEKVSIKPRLHETCRGFCSGICFNRIQKYLRIKTYMCIPPSMCIRSFFFERQSSCAFYYRRTNLSRNKIICRKLKKFFSESRKSFYFFATKSVNFAGIY